jgi:hypothetical protein
VLRPGGALVMELGFKTHDAVRQMLDGWAQVEITGDLAGIPRVVSALTRHGGVRGKSPRPLS